ncbi:MAG: DUF262 domain-containing protein [Subdoligranulum sp.]|nr:DUF262 domain-containing protein [Subdoligranulum sp.]
MKSQNTVVLGIDQLSADYNTVKDQSIVGDEVVIENQEELDPNAVPDEESVYPMKTIKLDKGFYTLFELKRKYEKIPSQIILDSSFQRNDVWKINQKRELIESILMGLPLPIFYFNEDRQGRLVVIDGRQRLTTFFEFMDEKKGFSLDNLKILSNLNKKKFRDLDTNLQTKIEDYQIIAHVIQQPTPDRIKFDIFDRVNRAGTQLNKQEIRNALYQGNATELLLKLSRTEEFAEATGHAFAKEVRMKDRYILLRFIAFYLYYDSGLPVISNAQNATYQYTGDIDEFLGLAMEYLNTCPEDQLEEIQDVTLKALKNAAYYLGKNAFRLTDTMADGSIKRYPININIFETLMFGMVCLPNQERNIREKVREAVENLKNSNTFRDSLNNHRDSETKVAARHRMIEKLVEDVL